MAGRISPRTRARLASVAGVLVACALIAGSLISLNRSVLPFSGWPTVKGQDPAQSEVPVVTQRQVASDRRAERGVRLADGRVVAVALPGLTAGAGATAPATTFIVPGAGPATPGGTGGTGGTGGGGGG